MTKQELTARSFRRARTRILIQLGGLIEKAGLLQDFGIELSADLQKDREMQKPVAALFYGLLELKDIIRSDDFDMALWSLKGLNALDLSKGLLKDLKFETQVE